MNIKVNLNVTIQFFIVLYLGLRLFISSKFLDDGDFVSQRISLGIAEFYSPNYLHPLYLFSRYPVISSINIS